MALHVQLLSGVVLDSGVVHAARRALPGRRGVEQVAVQAAVTARFSSWPASSACAGSMGQAFCVQSIAPLQAGHGVDRLACCQRPWRITDD